MMAQVDFYHKMTFDYLNVSHPDKCCNPLLSGKQYLSHIGFDNSDSERGCSEWGADSNKSIPDVTNLSSVGSLSL